eukprot:CAMPEP_0196575800 /NCGR_PEP_ID=MMETSP1081-20130531/5202_1 /TAXON_ID=36882 /ORGANISM="Pyramimonas amylifera, Strain CCMP720" /LENGTH=104 /DNA_ID=CAMNT_0041894209 /DNA_START=632 /DNA_END=943 /DNA_ORIENTATION=+
MCVTKSAAVSPAGGSPPGGAPRGGLCCNGTCEMQLRICSTARSMASTMDARVDTLQQGVRSGVEEVRVKLGKEQQGQAEEEAEAEGKGSGANGRKLSVSSMLQW